MCTTVVWTWTEVSPAISVLKHFNIYSMDSNAAGAETASTGTP